MTYQRFEELPVWKEAIRMAKRSERGSTAFIGG
jgi:hypothetical protein